MVSAENLEFGQRQLKVVWLGEDQTADKRTVTACVEICFEVLKKMKGINNMAALTDKLAGGGMQEAIAAAAKKRGKLARDYQDVRKAFDRHKKVLELDGLREVKDGTEDLTSSMSLFPYHCESDPPGHKTFLEFLSGLTDGSCTDRIGKVLLTYPGTSSAEGHTFLAAWKDSELFFIDSLGNGLGEVAKGRAHLIACSSSEDVQSYLKWRFISRRQWPEEEPTEIEYERLQNLAESAEEPAGGECGGLQRPARGNAEERTGGKCGGLQKPAGDNAEEPKGGGGEYGGLQKPAKRAAGGTVSFQLDFFFCKLKGETDLRLKAAFCQQNLSPRPLFAFGSALHDPETPLGSEIETSSRVTELKAVVSKLQQELHEQRLTLEQAQKREREVDEERKLLNGKWYTSSNALSDKEREVEKLKKELIAKSRQFTQKVKQLEGRQEVQLGELNKQLADKDEECESLVYRVEEAEKGAGEVEAENQEVSSFYKTQLSCLIRFL